MDYIQTTSIETHLDHNSTPEALAKSYDDWSGTYDEEIMTQLNCTGPRKCAETMEKVMGGSNLKEVRVLDVAAGTGLCAEELVKKGFTNIDAVDGSQKMLYLAEKKQIYRRLICDFVGPNPLDIEKGGYIVITFREEWLHLYEDFKDKLEPAMARLQEQGLWDRVNREIFSNYYQGKDGITIVYKVL
ncbi:methyltransferase-like protein 27 isoform X2 [Branchiostoma lanceolatum]|uniref:methyltransferase-like protein 27 isoform X2 n=1 Tax=Branchiostoma lanceolatum TaxID=7740 RepID=UPI003451CA4A